MSIDQLTFPIGGSVCSTDSPVKVVEGDGINVLGVSAMEEPLLCHIPPPIGLPHQILLPFNQTKREINNQNSMWSIIHGS